MKTYIQDCGVQFNNLQVEVFPPEKYKKLVPESFYQAYKVLWDTHATSSPIIIDAVALSTSAIMNALVDLNYS